MTSIAAPAHGNDATRGCAYNDFIRIGRVAVIPTRSSLSMFNWLIYLICFIAVLCTAAWRLAKSAVGVR